MAKRFFILALLLAGVGAASASRAAGSAITDLGSPANYQSTNQYFPLSGFHRVPTNLHRGTKPEFLFLGVQGNDQRVSMERWPVVKALTQFGRLSGVKAIDKQCTTIHGGPNNGEPFCSIPTYDFSHARFTSPYLTFVSKDLIRESGNTWVIAQRLSPTENAIYVRYARTHQTPMCVTYDSSGQPIKNGSGQIAMHPCKDFVNYAANSALPLLLIGNYLQTVTQLVNDGDFSQFIALTPPNASFPAYGYTLPYSFDTLRGALAEGKNPGTTSHLIENVNAEANIITALICHADGGKPSSVCHRSVIGQILKHVK
jgi:hypothetical protein